MFAASESVGRCLGPELGIAQWNRSHQLAGKNVRRDEAETPLFLLNFFAVFGFSYKLRIFSLSEQRERRTWWKRGATRKCDRLMGQDPS